MLVWTHGPIINWMTIPVVLAYEPMFASVRTRRPSALPWASRASSAWLSMSRPWVDERNSSRREGVHLTGRPSFLEA